MPTASAPSGWCAAAPANGASTRRASASWDFPPAAKSPRSPRRASTPARADAADPIDRLSSRPDFDVLIYPGIRANTYTIPKDMPPTFMLCADNDRGPSTALATLYPMLKAAGVQTEVHVYAAGGHGFGLNPNTKNPAVVATTWHCGSATGSRA